VNVWLFTGSTTNPFVKPLSVMYLSSLRLPALVLATTLLLTACGGKSDEQKAAEAAEQAAKEAGVSLGDAADAMQKMAKQMEDNQKSGKTVAVVDFRRLKELLPAEAVGLPRREATGEKNGAMGMSIAQAEGKYANDDKSERLKITLVDAGGTAMLMGLAAWTMVDIDKETADGYERTTNIGDYKAYETYKTGAKSGQVAVLVGQRFVVTLDGRGLPMDKLRDALKQVDLDKLAGMQ
jgi:hypothetical protein